MCTTIIVGAKATEKGHLFVARSADSTAMKAQHYVIHEARENQEGFYRCADYHGDNNFTWPLPKNAMRYTTAPNWLTQLHGATGFNEAGLGISGTESIFASDAVLALDPYNTESGVTEDDIPTVILPECKTAREGVRLLGRIIEEVGCGEGFGVAFVDPTEIWYLETGSGHQWMAQRLGDEHYFASGNQGRLQEYNPECDCFMGSKTLVSWAQENGFYDPAEGPFNFAKAYTRDDGRDRIYNDPRVWIMQKHLNPSLVQDPEAGRSFPVFMTPEKPMTLDDCRRMMRDHFEGTEHDPYAAGGRWGEEPWRPISVFRTYEAHVMEVRPELPIAIGETIHIAWGMSDLSVFMPFYQGLSKVPAQFATATNKCDSSSIYWKFRRVQTLAMTNYEECAPIVKAKYRAWEGRLEARRAVFEAQYLEVVKTDEAKAQEMLDTFNWMLLAECEQMADELLNELFTVRTASIEESCVFKNNKAKD